MKGWNSLANSEMYRGLG